MVIAKKPNRTSLTLDRDQLDRISAWRENHLCQSPTEVKFYELSVAETGIGQAVHFRCACGQEIDISDYENW